MEINTLYQNRFSSPKELFGKNKLWQVLCKRYFSRYVDKEACVLDMAAGYCEFINNIEARKKIAVDVNPDTVRYAATDVQVVQTKSSELNGIESNSVDVVFISNFFEHLTKEEILSTLSECRRVLKNVNSGGGGKIIVLQPNIKYVGADYWDFFDHHTPLTDKSIKEVLELSGFHVNKLIPGFLPYTTKSKIPQFPWLVALYLRIPFAWKIMGKQLLAIAEKK